MKIGAYYFSKIQTITLILLIIGLFTGLVLVQRQQVFKSRAAILDKPFEIIQNATPQEAAACEGKSCTTKTLNIIIKPVILENIPKSPIVAQVVPPPPKASALAQCLFIRSGDGPGNPKNIKSNRLIGYLQEASNLSGIPPVVLAAFIRVEHGSTLDENDATSWENNCPVNSSSGAIGVMQIMPKGTVGHDSGAVANGARLLGKSYNQLTYGDYCNARSNIIMGAGFILKKLSYSFPPAYPETYGDGSGWDPAWTNNSRVIEKMVYTYYGCILYNSCVSGPYSYASDVWTSIQNCPAGH